MKPIEFISRETLDQLLDSQVRKELQIIIGNVKTGRPRKIPGGPLTELDRQAWENAIAKLTHTHDYVPKSGIPSPSFLDQTRILTIQEVADMFGLDLLDLILFIENCPKAIPTLAIGDWVAFDRNSFAQWYVSQLHPNQ